MSDQTMTEEDMTENANATRADLERLNGLLIRALIRKLEEDKATATDIGNAVKVIISNRVSPEEPPRHLGGSGEPMSFDDLDFPVQF